MAEQHKHADLIKAWADGANIQYYDKCHKTWISASTPEWDINTQYRIKPSEFAIGQVWVRDGTPYVIAQVDYSTFALIKMIDDCNRWATPVECRFARDWDNILVYDDAIKMFGAKFLEFKLAKSVNISYELED